MQRIQVAFNFFETMCSTWARDLIVSTSPSFQNDTHTHSQNHSMKKRVKITEPCYNVEDTAVEKNDHRKVD